MLLQGGPQSGGALFGHKTMSTDVTRGRPVSMYMCAEGGAGQEQIATCSPAESSSREGQQVIYARSFHPTTGYCFGQDDRDIRVGIRFEA